MAVAASARAKSGIISRRAMATWLLAVFCRRWAAMETLNAYASRCPIHRAVSATAAIPVSVWNWVGKGIS